MKKEMGSSVNFETDLNPKYLPWDQRICAVADSDFFKAVKDKRAKIVTDVVKEKKMSVFDKMFPCRLSVSTKRE